MQTVTFKRDYDHPAKGDPNSFTAYRAGQTLEVTNEIAEAAKAAGAFKAPAEDEKPPADQKADEGR